MNSKGTDQWYNEIESYDFKNPTYNIDSTAQFTQLIWADTLEIGCGYAGSVYVMDDEPLGYFMVCRYSKAGNIGG